MPDLVADVNCVSQPHCYCNLVAIRWFCGKTAALRVGIHRLLFSGSLALCAATRLHAQDSDHHNGPSQGATRTPSDSREHSEDDEHAEADIEVDTDDVPTGASFEASAEIDPLRERAQGRGAAHFALDRTALNVVPEQDASEALRSLPGVYVARPEGDAVAPQFLIRGFDAEHGQDLAISVDGVPVNQGSHIHGQGYADLSFLIPELMERVRLTEGIYDPRQGDFATAGSVDYELGSRERGIFSRTSYGSFDTFRQMVLVAPHHEQTGTFVAAMFRNSRGFGANRAGLSASLHGQYEAHLGQSRLRVFGTLFGSRYGLAGALRRDDVATGAVDYYGSYGDATAQNQNAFALRFSLGTQLVHTGHRGSFLSASVFYVYNDFSSQRNFTGYLESSNTLPELRGLGDLIRQRNEDSSLGFHVRYRSEAVEPWSFLHAHTEIGVDGRLSLIGQSQDLISAPQNQKWDSRVDADVRAANIGGYADFDLAFDTTVRVRGGARVDMLLFDVTDRLGNTIPWSRSGTAYLPGFHRTATGFVGGPRITVEWRPLPDLRFSAAYGEGYRSPQARLLVDGESAPYAKARSADVGFTFVPGGEDPNASEDEATRVQLSAFYTNVSNDIAFDPSQGRVESLGPSTRIGATFYLRSEPLRASLGADSRWIVLGSLSYVRATVDSPPAASIDNPRPIFSPGDPLPYVPPFTVRAESRFTQTIAHADGFPIAASIAFGASILSPRPLPHGFSSQTIALLDAFVGVDYRILHLELSLANLLDSRYAALEYAYASSWSASAIESRLPTRHQVAGAPMTMNLTLGVDL